MAVAVDVITISYTGLDADSNSIDMVLLAHSLEGYARIIATASSFALTAQYHRQLDAMPVRAKVQEIRPGSFQIAIVLDYLKQGKLIPDVGEVIKSLLKWITAKLTRKPEANELERVLMKVLEQNGVLIANSHESHTRTQDTLYKMVEGMLPSAKKAAEPLGETCRESTLAMGQDAITVWDESDKRTIEDQVKPSVQRPQKYEVFISELDVPTGSSRVSFDAFDGARTPARISDPLLAEKDSPYALAMAHQVSLQVTAKAEILEGVIVRLHISDCESLEVE